MGMVNAPVGPPHSPSSHWQDIAAFTARDRHPATQMSASAFGATTSPAGRDGARAHAITRPACGPGCQGFSVVLISFDLFSDSVYKAAHESADLDHQ
jgi:hypothetical protein